MICICMIIHSFSFFILLLFTILSFLCCCCCCCLFILWVMCICCVENKNIFKTFEWCMQLIALISEQCVCTQYLPIILLLWLPLLLWLLLCVIGWMDRLIDSIELDRTRLTSPSSLIHFLTETIFRFWLSQLHVRFVEANLHDTIQIVEGQSTPSHTQTAPLRAETNLKVMMINWRIIWWFHTKVNEWKMKRETLLALVLTNTSTTGSQIFVTNTMQWSNASITI